MHVLNSFNLNNFNNKSNVREYFLYQIFYRQKTCNALESYTLYTESRINSCARYLNGAPTRNGSLDYSAS